MKTYLVYVQLGQNPAPILYDSARQALDCKNLETFLITDKPFLHNLFPGKVIEYHRSHNRRALKSFNRRYPDKRSMAGGYWLNTLERIFALNVLKNHVEYDAQIIHTESDVYSYLNEEILVTLNEMNINVAMPRFSPERGIGSFVYFRNFGFLEGSLDSFQKILDRESIENDMELFGFALNSGLIQQYEKAKWGVHEINGKKFVSFTYGGSKFVIVNLHLHSKEIIPEIDAENLIWTRVFNEANGISPRSVRTSGVTSVHAERPLIRTRIQTIRRLGLGNTLVLTARKLLRIIRSS